MPTFERLECFTDSIGKLEASINALPTKLKKRIEINVVDNNSSVAVKKKEICNKISESGTKVNFQINETNIGIDRNIAKCCTLNPNARFTWVLGDDDPVEIQTIPKLLEILIRQRHTAGLVILNDGTREINRTTRRTHASFEEYARLVITSDPYYLIAHTLISANVFRTSIFCKEHSDYSNNKMMSRKKLGCNFPHMYGIVSGLLESDRNYTITCTDFKSLDTSNRQPYEKPFGNDIYKLFYFYFMWILIEIGIPHYTIEQQNNLWWLKSEEPPQKKPNRIKQLIKAALGPKGIQIINLIWSSRR